MYCKTNSCDGSYKSIDVMLTTICPHSCAYCIAKNVKQLNDGKPDVDAMTDSIVANAKGRNDVLIMGGEPWLYPDELYDLVHTIKMNTKLKVYVTTAVPKSKRISMPNDKPETIADIGKRLNIIAWADGVNISVQHYNEDIANQMRGTTKESDWRQDFYKVIPFKDKIRINLNLVKGYLDTRKEVIKAVKHYTDMGFKTIKISELQRCPELFVSFEDIFGCEFQEPFAHGCQKEFSGTEKGILEFPQNTKIILKRSCYLTEPSLEPSEVCLQKFKEFQPKSNFLVVYNDGTVANEWLKERDDEMKDEKTSAMEKELKQLKESVARLERELKNRPTTETVKVVYQSGGDCHSGRGRTGHC